jgi:dihydropteroate synthase
LEPDLARLATEEAIPLGIVHKHPAYVVGPDLPVQGLDPIGEIRTRLEKELDAAQAMGLPRWLLIADPGRGLGDRPDDQLELFRRLRELAPPRHYPLLVEPAHPRLVEQVWHRPLPGQHDEASKILSVLAIDRGADILRLHDVQPVIQAVKVADTVTRALTHGR